MNEMIRTILERRSCRSFTKEPVSQETVDTILDCALCAPSGKGLETWQFTAVMDREKIQRLCKAVGEALGRGPEYNMYDPAVLIITSNEKDSKYREVDNACAMENIYLASQALGLGCVWINQLLTCFDEPKVREILREFGLPDSQGVYGCAAIGYPAEMPKEKARKGTKRIVG